jgi:hypothetical protein
MLVDLQLLVFGLSSQVDTTHIIDLHLAQGARPAVKSKDLVRKSNGLVPLQIRNSTASLTRSLRYILGSELFVQATLQCRDFLSGEVRYHALLEWVLDVAAAVLVAWTGEIISIRKEEQ